jgi:hypothetical protein
MFSAIIEQIGIFTAKTVAIWRHPTPPALILLVSFGLASCAVSPVGDGTTAATPDAKRAAVTARVNTRWEALIKGDLDAAYALLSPASRETITLEQFKSRTRKEGFREAKIESIDCSADTCVVRLMIKYDHRLMKSVQTPLVETWILDRGTPWLVYRG